MAVTILSKKKEPVEEVSQAQEMGQAAADVAKAAADVAKAAAENAKPKKGGLILTKKAPEAHVSTQMKDKKEVTSESTVSVPAAELPQVEAVFQQPWCEVRVSASYTHNLGNYQSAKVEVGLMIPCKHEEIDDVYKVANDWVDKRLNENIDSLQGGKAE